MKKYQIALLLLIICCISYGLDWQQQRQQKRQIVWKKEACNVPAEIPDTVTCINNLPDSLKEEILVLIDQLKMNYPLKHGTASIILEVDTNGTVIKADTLYVKGIHPTYLENILYQMKQWKVNTTTNFEKPVALYFNVFFDQNRYTFHKHNKKIYFEASIGFSSATLYGDDVNQMIEIGGRSSYDYAINHPFFSEPTIHSRLSIINSASINYNLSRFFSLKIVGLGKSFRGSTIYRDYTYAIAFNGPDVYLDYSARYSIKTNYFDLSTLQLQFKLPLFKRFIPYIETGPLLSLPFFLHKEVDYTIHKIEGDEVVVNNIKRVLDDTYDYNLANDIKPIDFSLALSYGVKIKRNNNCIVFNFKHLFGTSSIIDEAEENYLIKSRLFSFSIGYEFHH